MLQGTPDNPHLITVGEVVRPHGVTGEVRVRVYSDVPDRFNAGMSLHIGGIPYRIASSSRLSPELVVLKLHGLDTEAAARQITGQWVQSPESEAPTLPEGQYFHFQIMGMRVVTEDGEDLGEVTEILQTGSNDVYIVSGDGNDLLLPAISDVVLEVRLDRGEMLVRLLEGLR